MIRSGSLPFFLLTFLAAGIAGAAADPFSVQVIGSVGRTVTADLADLDGDGAVDLIQVVTFGMPPTEQRLVRVYLQDAEGAIPAVPSLETPLPSDCAAYDLADVDGVAGEDFLLLRPRGIQILSFARTSGGGVAVRASEARIPEDLTVGISSDERGLDRLALVETGLGDEPWLVAPGLGETFFLSASGELRARVASGVRANFFVESSGLIISESDIQVFLDAPRISVGDVNGDGRADIVASQRHHLLLFYQNSAGGFARLPSQTIELGRVSMEDHIRGSGAVRTKAEDIDRDGLADLIISQTTGGVMDAGFDTYIHFNRGQGWDLDKPDYAFEDSKLMGADALIDVDGDGRLELLHAGIAITILELIEIFLTEAIDANLRIFRLERPASAPAKPGSGDAWFEVKFDISLDFETSRTAGFIPSLEHDFNGDGFRDYIASTDGSRIEIFVGSPDKGYPKRSARQEIVSEGQIRAGDLNGDGLTDLVLFNTRRNDQSLKILTNAGILPGTVVATEPPARPEK
ncbi:MAG: VCBS repeat-containing protein [Myxococcota bacterium]|nr:VCBS repeat-containing protein [Myxococcota bacterium]